MYGLPAGFDGSRLVGRTLEQVSFTTNTIHFSFDDDVSITLESSLLHSRPGEPADSGRMRVPVRDSRLMQLVGMAVRSVDGSSDGTLSLTFTNDHRVSFFDDRPEYEAYCIRVGRDVIVV